MNFFGVRPEIDPASPSGVTYTNAVLYPKIPLDYEGKNVHRIKIKAKSAEEYEGLKKEDITESEIDLTIRVGNVNEPPKFDKDIFLFEGLKIFINYMFNNFIFQFYINNIHQSRLSQSIF